MHILQMSKTLCQIWTKVSTRNFLFSRKMSANSPPGKSDGKSLGYFFFLLWTNVIKWLFLGINSAEGPAPSIPPNPVESAESRIRDLDVDSIRRYLAQKLGFYETPESSVPVNKILDEVNLDGIVKWIKSERCKNIITLAGAGISTCK